MLKHRTTLLEVTQGVTGALGMLVDLGTPFLRGVRSHWGLSEADVDRIYPGDEFVPAPTWSWTHGIEIEAPADCVWPWVVQIGQDKAGFYSYAWLENLAGCQVENASAVHPEWQRLKVGDAFRLHPKAPPLRVQALLPRNWFVVTGGLETASAADTRAESAVLASWLLLVEPINANRSRFISRYRVSHGRDFLTRLAYGAWPVEAIGFMMDRAMLRGVKRCVESVD